MAPSYGRAHIAQEDLFSDSVEMSQALAGGGSTASGSGGTGTGGGGGRSSPHLNSSGRDGDSVDGAGADVFDMPILTHNIPLHLGGDSVESYMKYRRSQAAAAAQAGRGESHSSSLSSSGPTGSFPASPTSPTSPPSSSSSSSSRSTSIVTTNNMLAGGFDMGLGMFATVTGTASIVGDAATSAAGVAGAAAAGVMGVDTSGSGSGSGSTSTGNSAAKAAAQLEECVSVRVLTMVVVGSLSTFERALSRFESRVSEAVAERRTVST